MGHATFLRLKNVQSPVEQSPTASAGQKGVSGQYLWLVSSGTFRESDFDLTNQVFIFVPRKLHGTVTELIFDGAVINNTGCPKFIAISRVRRRKTSRKKFE